MVNSIMTMLEKENYIAGSTAPHWSHGASLVARRFTGRNALFWSQDDLLVAPHFAGRKMLRWLYAAIQSSGPKL